MLVKCKIKQNSIILHNISSPNNKSLEKSLALCCSLLGWAHLCFVLLHACCTTCLCCRGLSRVRWSPCGLSCCRRASWRGTGTGAPPESRQVWPLTHFFSPFCKKMDFPGGQTYDPLRGRVFFSSVPSRNSLISVSHPWSAFWADTAPRLLRAVSTSPRALLPDLLRYKVTVKWGGSCRGPSTSWRTTDSNLDFVFVKKLV